MQHLFDSHAHIYPAKIAEKAAKNIGAFYDLHMDFDGSVDKLLEVCNEVGVEKCLVHSVATTHEQVQKINNFIHESVAAHPDRFVGFCSLHPSMSAQEIEAEIDRVISLGLKGVKLHPDFQHFNIDDPHAMEMYEIIDGRLPILFHTGDKRFGYSTPSRLSVAAKRFPKQIMIAAHLGGYTEWDSANKCLPDLPNVYTDTCSSLAFMTPEKAKEYITAFGEDRVFFATDYPMWSAKDELERFNKIDLSDEAREKIFWKNICSLLNVEM